MANGSRRRDFTTKDSFLTGSVTRGVGCPANVHGVNHGSLKVRAKIMSLSGVFTPLGIALSEKQTPQITENIEKSK